MQAKDGFLDAIEIASPCSADWDAMAGDDRQRFCGDCQLHVYDFSGMTADEATKVVKSTEGRLCVRMFRREDGTVLTKDCPVGWAAVRKRVRLARVRVVAMLTLFCAAAVGCVRRSAPVPGQTPPPDASQTTPPGGTEELEPVDCRPVTGRVKMGKVKMGEVAVPVPPQPVMGIAAERPPTPEPKPDPNK